MNFHSINRIYTLFQIIVISSVMLGACSRAPEPALRLGTNIWPGYEPLYLARSLGHLKSDKVKLVEYVSATQVMRGLIDGAIDAGALTLDEAILLLQQGVDIRIVLVMDYSDGADALVARPDIMSLKALRGHRVGVETTALGAYMMHRVLEKGGLRLSEVKLVPLELSQHEQAYQDGTVDAVVTFDPVRSRLLAQGATSLLDSSQLPGEVVDVLVVRSDAVQQHKKHLELLLGAWFKTLAYIHKKPKAAAQAMMARLKLDQGGVLKAMQGVKFPNYKENRQLLTNHTMVLAKQARILADVMLKNNLVTDSVQADRLFDSDLLQQLYP